MSSQVPILTLIFKIVIKILKIQRTLFQIGLKRLLKLKKLKILYCGHTLLVILTVENVGKKVVNNKANRVYD